MATIMIVTSYCRFMIVKNKLTLIHGPNLIISKIVVSSDFLHVLFLLFVFFNFDYELTKGKFDVRFNVGYVTIFVLCKFNKLQRL